MPESDTGALRHDDELCAASNADDPGPRTETERCIEARVYGPCAHELCGGVCEWQRDCACSCHEPDAAASYSAKVNAPLPCSALIEIGREIANGNAPRYRRRERRDA